MRRSRDHIYGKIMGPDGSVNPGAHPAPAVTQKEQLLMLLRDPEVKREIAGIVIEHINRQACEAGALRRALRGSPPKTDR